VLHQEVVHPNWPTLYPRLLTDGKLIEIEDDDAPLAYRNDVYTLNLYAPVQPASAL
jgi:hypothetical protein